MSVLEGRARLPVTSIKGKPWERAFEQDAALDAAEGAMEFAREQCQAALDAYAIIVRNPLSTKLANLLQRCDIPERLVQNDRLNFDIAIDNRRPSISAYRQGRRDGGLRLT
jgi:hypothetical protein